MGTLPPVSAEEINLPTTSCLFNINRFLNPEFVLDILDTSAQLQQVGNRKKALQALMRTFNYIALATSAFYVPVYYFFENYFYIPFQILTVLLLLPNFYFIKRGLLTLSAYWLSLTLGISVFCAAIVTPMVQVELLLICITSVVQAMFAKKRDSIICFLFLIGLFVTFSVLKPGMVPITNYSPESVKLIELTNIIFIFVVIFILIYYFRNTNDNFVLELRKKSQQLLDKNETIRLHQKEFYQVEVENTKKDLQLVVSSNNTKRLVREDLIGELTKIKQEDDVDRLQAKLKQLVRKLNRLNQIDARSDYLHSKIQEVNTTFNNQLRSINPKLSKSETELCGLIILGLSTKEISEIRNSTANSTNVLKHRLKKKLFLTAEEDITKFLRDLSNKVDAGVQPGLAPTTKAIDLVPAL